MAACLGIGVAATPYTQGWAALDLSPVSVPGSAELSYAAMTVQYPWSAPENEEAAEADFAQIYADRMALVQEFTDTVEAVSAELDGLLIDYDVLLQKLNIQISRYEVLADEYDAAALQVKTGTMKSKELKPLREACEAQLAEVEAVLLPVAEQKAAIEEITGQTLKSTFNFDSLYYITDAIKLSPQKFNDFSGLDSICRVGELAFEAFAHADCEEPLAAAQEQYALLGEAMTLLIEAEEYRKETNRLLQMGEADAAAYKEANTAYEDAYLAAYEAKAAYAKSLIALDLAMNGALIEPMTVSSALADAYRNTMPVGLDGPGLWRINRIGGGRIFYPLRYPLTVTRQDTYTITYRGKELGSSTVNAGMWLDETEFDPQEPFAYVTFYRNGVVLTDYALDVFSPIGTFLEIIN